MKLICLDCEDHLNSEKWVMVEFPQYSPDAKGICPKCGREWTASELL